MSYNKDKILVTKMEDKFYSENRTCSCCGKTVKNQNMWKASYNSPKIDPLYFCHKCAPSKSDIAKILGCNDTSELTTTDLLYSLIAILKIKDIKIFSPYHLMEFIKECKTENKFDYILEDWNSILAKFDSTISEMLSNGTLNKPFPKAVPMVAISSTLPISKILRKKEILDNLEEILAFTNDFQNYEYNIYHNRNYLFNDINQINKRIK